jgi:hypothetical protein
MPKPARTEHAREVTQAGAAAADRASTRPVQPVSNVHDTGTPQPRPARAPKPIQRDTATGWTERRVVLVLDLVTPGEVVLDAVAGQVGAQRLQSIHSGLVESRRTSRRRPAARTTVSGHGSTCRRDAASPAGCARPAGRVERKIDQERRMWDPWAGGRDPGSVRGRGDRSDSDRVVMARSLGLAARLAEPSSWWLVGRRARWSAPAGRTWHRSRRFGGCGWPRRSRGRRRTRPTTPS